MLDFGFKKRHMKEKKRHCFDGEQQKVTEIKGYWNKIY